MRCTPSILAALLLAAIVAPAQSTLVLHVRYNPFLPPSADTVHMLLLARGVYTPGFVDASNPVIAASVAVDGTVVGGQIQSSPTVLRDALINAVNTSGTGYTAVAN